MEKIKYYSQEHVAETYLDERYSGKSGGYVNGKELNAMKSILPGKGVVLDVACGVGRLNSIFNGNGYKVTGLDSSEEMLKRCPYSSKKVGDALKLPFEDDTFDIVITSRFFHHYPNPEDFLKEFKRVLKKGGSIIFETYRWSLKKYYFNSKKGGKIYIHSDRRVKKMFKDLDLKLQSKKSVFLLSPYMYIHLPYFFVSLLGLLEKMISDKLRYTVFWRVIKD